MSIFRRKSQEVRRPPQEVTELPLSAPVAVERGRTFEDKFEAGAYVVDLLAQADGKVKAFYDDAKSRGMSDDDIMEATKDAVLAGYLPGLVERAGPSRGGVEPIYFVDTLPEDDKARVEAFVGSERVRIVTGESEGLRELRRRDQAILITPRHAVAKPQLTNSQAKWTELTSKLKKTVDVPENQRTRRASDGYRSL